MSDSPQIPRDREGGILKRQPLNTNPAFASNFRLVIPKVRGGVYFCTEVSFPELVCDPVKIPVPMAPSLKFFGNKVSHGDLSVKFVVNEDYSNYGQMNDWFKSTLVFSDFFTGNTSSSIDIVTNTGYLLILTNKKTPIAKFHLNGLMITGLSSIEYNSAMTDASATTATATFQFSTYDLEAIVDG
jgi:hypothetical protein